MTVLSLDHGLDPVVLVPRQEQERRALLADGLVLLEARLDAMGARRVRALADEARLGGAEALRRLGDPLVHLAEQRLRLRDLLCFLLGHCASLGSLPALSGWTTAERRIGVRAGG